jgi:hypothetical protein
MESFLQIPRQPAAAPRRSAAIGGGVAPIRVRIDRQRIAVEDAATTRADIDPAEVLQIPCPRENLCELVLIVLDANPGFAAGGRTVEALHARNFGGCNDMQSSLHQAVNSAGSSPGSG